MWLHYIYNIQRCFIACYLESHIAAHNQLCALAHYIADAKIDTILWWVYFTNATGLSVVCVVTLVQCISPFFSFALSQVLSKGAGNEEEIQHGHNRVLMVGVKSFVFTNHCATDAFSIFCEHIRILRFTV